MERTPQSPPVINPVQGVDRPLWSVMIPVFNCIEYIRTTIETVLIQDPGAELMQIEVIDDASTDGNIEELVMEMGKGRIIYYRQDENVGSLRNFETCLNRSRGYLIHLLHGDDMIKPGFYKEMEALFESYPQIGSAFCKNSFINKLGEERAVAESLQPHAGIIENWLEKISLVVYCQPPAVVVKRAVYEKLGSFYGGHYGEDWEMWCRIAAHYDVAYSPSCLAMYRSHPNNISARSHLSGQSIKDIEKFMGIIQSYLPENKRRKALKSSKKLFSTLFAVIASRNFYGDRQRYLDLAFKSFLMDQNITTASFLTRIVLNYLFQIKNHPDDKST
jgi:glycosyltransferase involved in cell wall biosynthesis